MNRLFAQLHDAIQDSFGWQQCHLWAFRPSTGEGDPIAGLPDDFGFGPPTPDATQVKLSTHFTGKRPDERCHYIYDFGDDWLHEVTLITVRSDKNNFKRRLLGGERSCPPEDCGGAPGYERLVHFLEHDDDPYGDDPDQLRAWLRGWRPDAFELKKAAAEFDS